jgi:hypothetical protein
MCCGNKSEWNAYVSAKSLYMGEIDKGDQSGTWAACFESFPHIEIDWLFTVLRPAQEYFTYMETSPLPVKGCKS